MRLAEEILHRAEALQYMIATAESCTGGMVAAALTDIPGASTVIDRGFVTYTNRAKIEMLDVSRETLLAHGAVSEEVAAQMAQGAKVNSGAQLSVSITGIAGPGGSEHKPEGRVCFGLVIGNTCHTQTVEFGALGRAIVRRAARDHALLMLRDALRASP